MTTRDQALAAEAAIQRAHGDSWAERRAELVLKGICPDSLLRFEVCSKSICDCGWEGCLPWEEQS